MKKRNTDVGRVRCHVLPVVWVDDPTRSHASASEGQLPLAPEFIRYRIRIRERIEVFAYFVRRSRRTFFLTIKPQQKVTTEHLNPSGLQGLLLPHVTCSFVTAYFLLSGGAEPITAAEGGWGDQAANDQKWAVLFSVHTQKKCAEDMK